MSDFEQPSRRVFSVSELNNETKKCLEQRFFNVFVRGEISNFSAPRSGHWYFTLKDESAQIRVVMFKNANLRHKPPKLGDELILGGQLSFYRERGEVQIIANSLRSAGLGDLQQQFDELKKTLLAEGLFEQSKKAPLPTLPKKIGVITSASGAVIEDIRRITARRAAAMPMLLIPARVQGNEAIEEICNGISICNRRDDIDLIVVARGGGSLEDMQAFNSERVARAIAASKIPIISAVGHETDTSIADFVADVRAATPSEAAEIATAGYQQLRSSIDLAMRRTRDQLTNNIVDKGRILEQLALRLKNPADDLRYAYQKLDSLEARLDATGENIVTSRQQSLRMLQQSIDLEPIRVRVKHYQSNLSQQIDRLDKNSKEHRAAKQAQFHRLLAVLEAVSPLKTMSRGYSIVFDKDGKLVDSTENLNVGEEVAVRLNHGRFSSKVTELL